MAAAPETTYAVRGTLQAWNPAAPQATIAHQAIPGYMEAMTMDFAVRSPEDLRGVTPGSEISFVLHVTAGDAWITDVHPTGAWKAAPPASGGNTPVPGLAPGDLVPDTALQDADGRELRLHTYRGQVLAVTFFYARCPLPTYCPRLSQNFQGAQEILLRLRPDAGPEPQWHLLSVSFDSHDTPAGLRSYAQGYAADPRHWSFATGTETAVRALGGGFGLEFTTGEGVLSHNLRTAVIDADGRLRRIFSGSAWTPQELAAEIEKALRHPHLSVPAEPGRRS